MGGVSHEITITLPNQHEVSGDHIAMTRTGKRTDTGEIIKSKVLMTPYAGEKLLVLEQELGHALGWRHHRVSYHIMYPEWREIGHSARGLEWNDYLAEMERIRAPGRH